MSTAQKSAATEITHGLLLAMNFFRLAEFTDRVTQMTDDEFEALCKKTRKLIAATVREHNRRVPLLTAQERTDAENRSILTNQVDATNVFRYCSEIEATLRQLRKQTK